MKLNNILKLALATVLVCGGISSSEAVTKKSASRSKAHTTANSKSSNSSAPKVTAGAVHNYSNGLTTREYSVKKGDSSISIEYPVAGNEGIVEALKRYIAEEVYISDNKNQKLVYSFGVNETPEAFLQKAIRPYKSKGSFGMNGEIIVQNISVIYSNDDVLTLRNSGDVYGGGSHGIPWEEGTSFLMSDGSCMTYSMLPSIRIMKPYLETGLAEAAECSVNELNDIFFIDSLDYPSGEGVTPYVDAGGLNIQYGVYEIGPYAIGMPKVVIPKSKARQICSGEALKFLN